MKFRQIILAILTCLLLLPISAFSIWQEQKTEINTSVSQDWLSSALTQIKRDEYNPSLQTSDYKGEQFSKPRLHFTNRAQNLRAYFDENGMELIPRVIGVEDTWNLKYRLNSIYRTNDNIKIYNGLEPEISDEKIIYQYQGVTLEYSNSETGIELIITIMEKTNGERNLFIKTDIDTQNLLFTKNEDNCVIFSSNEDEIIYRILKVEDRDKKTLSGSIGYDNDQFTISVDDKYAHYPIFVNLLISSNNEWPDKELSHKNNILGLSETPDWTAEGDQVYAYFGWSVSTAGDVNGDGYSDVIVGANGYDNGEATEGRTFVYHGSASGLSSSASWTAEGNQEGANFGYSVSTAGDVNGDGYSDIIVGAVYYDNGEINEGRAYVYHGSAGGLAESATWNAEGNQEYAWFGISVSTAGDVNGDGYSDVIVGANLYDNGEVDEGAAFVYHGSSDGLSGSASWSAEGDQANAWFGRSVSTAGDVNGDGYSDVIVGAYHYDNGETDEGCAFVYHGSASGLSPSANWTAEGDQDNANFGSSASTAGDVNGDGYSDVIVGAVYYDNGETNEGAAFVYHGSSSGLSETANWTAEGDQVDARFGFSVSTTGDVNGDGYSDVIVGALVYDNGETNEGRTFVYHGSAGGLSSTATWTAEGNQVDAYFGWSLSTAGDVNGDGYSDVIVGAHIYDNGEVDEGCAFVYHGSASGLSSSASWTAEGDQIDAYFGVSVYTAGDVNGDGYSDVIIGANWYDNGEIDEGHAFVYHGSHSGLSPTSDWTAEGDQADAHFGSSVSTAGDVNGDGYSDVIVGAGSYDNGETDEGRAFVYHGSAGGLSSNAIWTAEGDQSYAWFGRSVSTAGDVNGDGYSDVIVGADGYYNGETNEGRAFVFHGGASGLSSSAIWTAEGDQSNAYFGYSVSTAGDVNGDGYSDVIVGAYSYDNGEDNEGRAFVYHGSTSGLSVSAIWAAEGDQVLAYFGESVSTAGDVNGDGYSDVIVGAGSYDNGEVDEGRAFVYHGSEVGLSSSASWTAEGNQEHAYFGESTSMAGDVNGDGYSDVIVGADGYDNGETNEGSAFVYHGSASGLSPIASWTAEGDQSNAYFGESVSTAGDVNGDGYSDVIVGAYCYDNGEDNEGRAFVYHGNSDGIALVPRQTRAVVVYAPVQLLNKTNSNAVRLRLLGRTPAGRGKVKLQWEIKELGQLLDGTNLGISSDWYDTGVDGIQIAEDISSLQDSTPYHWRVRLMYSPLTYNGSLSSRWLSIGPNGMNETDFITTTLSGIEEESSDSTESFIMNVTPAISNQGFKIKYYISKDEVLLKGTPLSIKVYDKSGRLVKKIFDGRKSAGLYEAEWNGDDERAKKVPSGVYFIYLKYGEHRGIKKAIFVR